MINVSNFNSQWFNFRSDQCGCIYNLENSLLSALFLTFLSLLLSHSPSSGEVEDPDYDDCMACEEGCRKCVLCKSWLSGQGKRRPQQRELSSQRRVVHHVQGFFPVAPYKVELSCFVCFRQITPGIACPALTAFTSKAMCLAVAMCDLNSPNSLCVSAHF